MDQGNSFIPGMNTEYLIQQFAEDIIVKHSQAKRSKPMDLEVDLSWLVKSHPWSQSLRDPEDSQSLFSIWKIFPFIPFPTKFSLLLHKFETFFSFLLFRTY